MILPSDASYQETKRIKKAGTPLEGPYRELAAWMATEYQVEVLNFHYDTMSADGTPRLDVIVETREDQHKFRDGGLGNYSQIDQKRIAERFTAIVQELGDARFETDSLFVVFSAFEPLARIEANESVKETQLDSLKARLANPELWEISRLFDSVTFLFYTDAQVKKYEAAGLREEYSREYENLVLPYDEFGYLKKSSVGAFFDSKENFDKNYGSNWYYYYK